MGKVNPFFSEFLIQYPQEKSQNYSNYGNKVPVCHGKITDLSVFLDVFS